MSIEKLERMNNYVETEKYIKWETNGVKHSYNKFTGSLKCLDKDGKWKPKGGNWEIIKK